MLAKRSYKIRVCAPVLVHQHQPTARGGHNPASEELKQRPLVVKSSTHRGQRFHIVCVDLGEHQTLRMWFLCLRWHALSRVSRMLKKPPRRFDALAVPGLDPSGRSDGAGFNDAAARSRSSASCSTLIQARVSSAARNGL